MKTKLLGDWGEQFAIQFLKDKGYRILLTNYRNKYGEIDIIAKDRDVLCFVEVKTRTSWTLNAGCEAVSFQKQRKMSQIATYYLCEKGFLDAPSRFDVISICTIEGQKKAEIFKNAFEAVLV